MIFSLKSKLRSAVHRIWPPDPRPLILMYHRIADVPVDHWSLAVSPARFDEQLNVLRRTRRPFPLADFVHGLKVGTLPQDAIAVTFDDGYLDNLVAGKPRLEAADVPATVFLPTGYLDRPGEFWWDELARLILLENAPQSFELVIHGKSMRFDLGIEPAAPTRGSLRTAASRRCLATLDAVWRAIRRLEEGERELIMVQLRSIFSGRSCSPPPGRAMTGDEVRALVADGLVTIGAHTVTHPVLSELDPAACQQEIMQSKLDCEALIGAPVSAFAYPYGDFDHKASESAKASGFAFACSTRHGPALTTSDVFALPRIQVPDCDGDAFERILRSASAAV